MILLSVSNDSRVHSKAKIKGREVGGMEECVDRTSGQIGGHDRPLWSGVRTHPSPRVCCFSMSLSDTWKPKGLQISQHQSIPSEWTASKNSKILKVYMFCFQSSAVWLTCKELYVFCVYISLSLGISHANEAIRNTDRPITSQSSLSPSLLWTCVLRIQCG